MTSALSHEALQTAIIPPCTSSIAAAASTFIYPPPPTSPLVAPSLKRTPPGFCAPLKLPTARICTNRHQTAIMLRRKSDVSLTPHAVSLAMEVDRELDRCYGYGLSTQDMSTFGAQACLGSAVAGWRELTRQHQSQAPDTLRAQSRSRPLRQGSRRGRFHPNVEQVAAQVHAGWAQAARQTWDGVGYGLPSSDGAPARDSATGRFKRDCFSTAKGLAKYQARMRLADCPFGELAEEEKEKDRVAAKALIARYQATYVSPPSRNRAVSPVNTRTAISRCTSTEIQAPELGRAVSPVGGAPQPMARLATA